MWYLREKEKVGLNKIAKLLGLSNHATVYHHLTNHPYLLQQDGVYRHKYELMEAAVNEILMRKT